MIRFHENLFLQTIELMESKKKLLTSKSNLTLSHITIWNQPSFGF